MPADVNNKLKFSIACIIEKMRQANTRSRRIISSFVQCME
jgi:hypothetical protein